jgi:AcrR family transcriptional regulator
MPQKRRAPVRQSTAERIRHVSRARREKAKEELSRNILQAAGALFLKHGYEGISMRQIAETIGYSATTIYRHYENKDDLLFAIVYEGFVKFNQALGKASKVSGDPLSRLKSVCAAYVMFGLKNPIYYQLMFMQRFDFLFEKRSAQQAPMIASFEVMQQIVTEAIQTGRLKRGDPETTSTVLWAVGHGITSLAIADPKRFSKRRLEEIMHVTMQMILSGLVDARR